MATELTASPFEKKIKVNDLNSSEIPPWERGTSIDGKYDYDLIVIGGGSGGLAASKVSVFFFLLQHKMIYIYIYIR